MASLAEQRLTPHKYLAIERAAKLKSEFFAGRMYAMAGGSPEHALIASNVNRELGTQLKRRPCRVYTSDLRVKVSATGLYTYPDVTVVCGEPQFDDEQRDTLVNPTLIVEVLSETTEAYDRGEKFAQYRQVASLQEYLLITQDRQRVERYTRQVDGHDWLLTEISDPEDAVALASVGAELPLSEIYDKVDLPPGTPPFPRRQI